MRSAVARYALAVVSLAAALAVSLLGRRHDDAVARNRPRNFLKVVDESVIHRCAAERADNRHGLHRETTSAP